MDIAFQRVIALLRKKLEDLPREARKIPVPKDALESEIKELKAAIACLEMAEIYGIPSGARVVELPLPKTLSPSSEFRVIEDHESEDRGQWTEVTVDHTPLRPSPGDLLVFRGKRT